ncbi:hypothetical protein EH359_13550 [Enterococcus faecium]|nr:hypothetical protein [Enterococcus faecium]
MFLWLKTLYRKRAVTWPFIFYTIIWTLSEKKRKKIKITSGAKEFSVIVLLYSHLGTQPYPSQVILFN